ncbi:MAG: hypothetical protein WAX89_03720 [Alphaproteobacteria bacterium]
MDTHEVIANPYDPRRTYEQHGDWKRAIHESEAAIHEDRWNEYVKENNVDKVNEKFDRWENGRQESIQKLEPAMNKERGISPSSLLDGLKDTANTVGNAVSSAGQAAFAAAMTVGKDAITQTVLKAAVQGGFHGRTQLAHAAKVALAHTLGSMHSVVQQQVELTYRPTGIAGPLKDPEPVTQEAIGRTIENPQNLGVFHKVAQSVEAMLRRHPDADPTAVLVTHMMNALRAGHLKVEPLILVPDLPMNEQPHVSTKVQPPLADIFNAKKRDNTNAVERVADVFGIALPIKLSEVMVMDESGATGVSTAQSSVTPQAFRHTDGKVYVRAYTRSDGTPVASHTRMAPDETEANNFSFPKKM